MPPDWEKKSVGRLIIQRLSNDANQFVSFTRRNMSPLVLLVLTLMAATPGRTAECPSDYTPCTCQVDSFGQLQVACNQVDVDVIQSVFRRTNETGYLRVQMKLPRKTTVLPADLLAGKHATVIDLSCFEILSPVLAVDPGAFISTSSYTTTFNFDECDLKQFDFTFLQGFNSLTVLGIANSDLESVDHFPTLRSLTTVAIINCPKFQQWNALAQLPGLTDIVLQGNELDDRTAEAILTSVWQSPSGKVLRTVNLSQNQLTRSPALFSLFPNLFVVDLSFNPMIYIATGALSFSAPVGAAYLQGGTLSVVEAGAFTGDFSHAYVRLSANRLTQLDSPTYKSLLESMATGTGQLYLDGNGIYCSDCQLAWLIRDNRHLLASVVGGTCENSTTFEQLSPDGYADCPPLAGSTTSQQALLVRSG